MILKTGSHIFMDDLYGISMTGQTIFSVAGNNNTKVAALLKQEESKIKSILFF